jgi:hypothetical protein
VGRGSFFLGVSAWVLSRDRTDLLGALRLSRRLLAFALQWRVSTAERLGAQEAKREDVHTMLSQGRFTVGP